MLPRPLVTFACLLGFKGALTTEVIVRPESVTKISRAPLGYLAERAPLRGGGFRSPLPNSGTRGRSEVGEAEMKALDEYFLSN